MQKTVFGLLVSAALLIFLASMLFQATKAQTAGIITGSIILRDSVSGGVSIIPYSLPGTSCRLNIVACDMGGQPPEYVGVGNIYSADPRGEYAPATSYNGSGCGKIVDFDDCCIYDAYCKPADPCIRLEPIGQGCDTGCGTVYSYDRIKGVCCDLDGEDNIPGTADDNVQSGDRCCPKDYPFYDPVSQKCVRFETLQTKMNRFGLCSYASVASAEPSSYLFFFQADGNSSSATADYVTISYVCSV
ncbi:MAG: hypothetical protein GXO63_00755 [Candidatus Micrarchaeota archaeon]|nr:hypothetical protein [Candidatus Micrarchaeota archaeon]